MPPNNQKPTKLRMPSTKKTEAAVVDLDSDLETEEEEEEDDDNWTTPDLSTVTREEVLILLQRAKTQLAALENEQPTIHTVIPKAAANMLNVTGPENENNWGHLVVRTPDGKRADNLLTFNYQGYDEPFDPAEEAALESFRSYHIQGIKRTSDNMKENSPCYSCGCSCKKTKYSPDWS